MKIRSLRTIYKLRWTKKTKQNLLLFIGLNCVTLVLILIADLSDLSSCLRLTWFEKQRLLEPQDLVLDLLQCFSFFSYV